MEIRVANQNDTAALLKIYAPYVLETAITFEYDVPSETEFARRIETTLQRYPYLVAQEDGRILGYAYAAPYKSRTAYDWSVEVTAYVDREIRAKGIGTQLYQQLEQLLTQQHVVNLTACVTGGNQESLQFHEKAGYQQVACFSGIGYKFGTWHDVLWLQKKLPVPVGELKAFRTFPQISGMEKEK